MPSNNDAIHWDPLPSQLDTGGGEWQHLANDGPIRLYKRTQGNRWLMEVVNNRGQVVGSALCYSSSSLGIVAAEFHKLAESGVV